MNYRGSLPPGQAFNGQQQYPPSQGGYSQVYGNEQEPAFEDGFINPSALQQQPPMFYGGGLGTDFGGVGSANSQTFMPQFDGYQQQPMYQAPAPIQQFQPPPQRQPQAYVDPTRIAAPSNRPAPLPAAAATVPSPVQQPAPIPTPVPIPQPAPVRQPVPTEPLPQTIQPSALQLQPRPFQYTKPITSSINGAPLRTSKPPLDLPGPSTISPRATPAPSPALSQKSPALSQKSPALSQKSPGVTKRSPSLATKPKPFDTSAVLVSIGEECIQKAHEAAQSVAITTDPERVAEYQHLVSTGLHCLETAIQSSKLMPRQEAKARLRYAALLCAETENFMEAEATLSKGIALCDQHRYQDLKYCMQYLLLKVLYRRTPKAALKAAEKYIADASAFKHIPWAYAFRFLKASFYAQSGSTSESAALENLKAIAALATEQRDSAVIIFTSLLEALTLLKSLRKDTITRVQTCLAQASKYQHEQHAQIPQLRILWSLVDLSCSTHQKAAEVMVEKLKVMKQCLTEAHQTVWGETGSEIALPIRKPMGSQRIISEDTGSIIRLGAQKYDYIVVSFMTKPELQALSFTFSGVASLYRPKRENTKEQKSLDIWQAALGFLIGPGGKNSILDPENAPRQPPGSLRDALQKEKWRKEIYAYLQVLIGLYAATQSNWEKVLSCIRNLESAISPSVHEGIGLLALYLTGVYHQGTGNLDTAMGIFSDESFAIKEGETGAIRSAQLDVSFLAALNRLWIMQHPKYRDGAAVTALFDQLRPLCSAHHDPDMQAAFSIVEVTAQTSSPLSLFQIKNNMGLILNMASKTGNQVFQAQVLTAMRDQLFKHIVGEQAVKSARAASTQTQKVGNPLWMSVADGLLAKTFGSMGLKAQEEQALQSAIQHAMRAQLGTVITRD